MAHYLVLPNSRPQDAQLVRRDALIAATDERSPCIIYLLLHDIPIWIVGLRDGIDNRTIQIHDAEDTAKAYQTVLAAFHSLSATFLLRIDDDAQQNPNDATA
jgi:hypothetical protein